MHVSLDTRWAAGKVTVSALGMHTECRLNRIGTDVIAYNNGRSAKHRAQILLMDLSATRPIPRHSYIRTAAAYRYLNTSAALCR